MSHTGLALQVFMAGDDDIIVKEGWKPHPGEPMPQTPGVFIGKQFGAGALAFNTIFDLVDQEGKTTNQALKVCRPTLAARRSLAHEWKMFKDLRLLGNEFEAARSHFLQAHRVMRLNDGRIAGIVMEKANGKNVDKTLKDPHFCNVRYVIALLRDLLVGLDVAQRVLGFTHYDLKLDNVMEHWTSNKEAGQARVLVDAVPQFKIFDFGTAVVYPDPFAMHHAVDQQLEEHRPSEAPHLAEQRPHNYRGNITKATTDSKSYEYSTPFFCVRLYHIWWKQRGDVFRVLSALCKKLDDRTWPLEDLELVSLLFTVLEHTTNSRRIKARFEPRTVLLHRIYGPRPPPPAPASSLTTAQTLALLHQHSQMILQGSTSMGMNSQGSSALPTVAAIEAYSRQQQHNKQQRQKHNQLQGVAEGEGELEGEKEGLIAGQANGPSSHTANSSSVVQSPHPLRINTTKLPVDTAATAGVGVGQGAAPNSAVTGAGAAGGKTERLSLQPPPSPTGNNGAAATGGQYTPRRSMEVSRQELAQPVPGMTYVRLAKAAEPAAAADAAADIISSNSSTPPHTPFAGYGAQGGQATAFSPGGNGVSSSNGGNSRPAGTTAAGGAVPGVQQLVSMEGPEQRQQRHQKIVAPIQSHLQQQQQQQLGSNIHTIHPSSPVAAATAAAAAAGRSPASTPTKQQQQQGQYVVAAAPEGVPDPFAPAPPGMSSNTAPEQRHEVPPSDPSQPHRADSANTIVAKQPVAPAAQQSVLGSRKALRGVTAQQLLVEPIVQSLLSKA